MDGVSGAEESKASAEKGTASADVQRQYSGTARRIENSQVGGYVAYSTPRGHAAVDRELYVPRCSIEYLARCQAAGISNAVVFTPSLLLRPCADDDTAALGDH